MVNYKKSGVTLIELVISIGLIGVITGVVFSLFFSNKRTLDKVDIKSDLQYEAKEVMNEISKHAMEASNIKFGEGTVTFLIVDTESTESVVFTVKGGSTRPSLLDNPETNTVTMTGNRITLGTGISTDKEICTSLKSIKLTTDKGKNIQVELSLERKGVMYSVNDSFWFRNAK